MELDFNSYKSGYQEYKNIYLDLLNKTISYLHLDFSPIVSVSFVSKRFIKNLNRDYRNIDKITDVISFAFLDGEDRKSIFNSKTDVVLGDIYICLDVAISQANNYGHSLNRELRFLFIHGLLHLLGYDHMKKEDEEIMFPLQEEILKL